MDRHKDEQTSNSILSYSEYGKWIIVWLVYASNKQNDKKVYRGAHQLISRRRRRKNSKQKRVKWETYFLNIIIFHISLRNLAGREISAVAVEKGEMIR